MTSLINKQLLLTAYAYLFIMEQQKDQQGGEALLVEQIEVEEVVEEQKAVIHASQNVVVRLYNTRDSDGQVSREYEEIHEPCECKVRGEPYTLDVPWGVGPKRVVVTRIEVDVKIGGAWKKRYVCEDFVARESGFNSAETAEYETRYETSLYKNATGGTTTKFPQGTIMVALSEPFPVTTENGSHVTRVKVRPEQGEQIGYISLDSLTMPPSQGVNRKAKCQLNIIQEIEQRMHLNPPPIWANVGEELSASFNGYAGLVAQQIAAAKEAKAASLRAQIERQARQKKAALKN